MQAPPDFQRQVLTRVRQPQPWCMPGREPSVSAQAHWPGRRAWDIKKRHWHRRFAVLAIGTAGGCGLVLSVSLSWWLSGTDPAARTTLPGSVAHIIAPQRYTLAVPYEAGERFAGRESGENARAPRGGVLTEGQAQPWTAWGEDKTAAVDTDHERGEFFPPTVPPMQPRRESKLSQQRSERPQGVPGKSTRPKKGLKPVKPAPT